MMPLHNGWGWYPPQTSSHIHIRHIISVWGVCMLSQGHMSAPLYHYTGQGCPQFWDFGSILEWKWCHWIPLHHGWGWYPPQTGSCIHIRHIQCAWVICMLSQWHMGAPLYPYTRKVGPRFWNLGHLWTENDAITSWLRLSPTSDCFPHLHKTYKNMFEVLFCCLKGLWVHPYTILLVAKLAPDFELLGHLWSGNDAITLWLRLISTLDCFPKLS